MVQPIKQLRDKLEEKTAEDLQQPVALVNDVMSWVFKDVVKAYKIYREVELSGFGAHKLAPAKIKRRIIKLERMKGRLEIKEPRTELIQTKLDSINNALQYFYSRQNGMEENFGGLQESDNSASQAEGANSEDSLRASGNMQEV